MIVGAEINEHTFGFSVPFPTRPKDHEVFTLSTRMHSVLSNVLDMYYLLGFLNYQMFMSLILWKRVKGFEVS